MRCSRAQDLDALLGAADCVSLHAALDDSTWHLIDARRLALIQNQRRAGQYQPLTGDRRSRPGGRLPAPTGFSCRSGRLRRRTTPAAGLTELDNVVIVPHIASATGWTRQGMATLAASNVAAVVSGAPVWNRPDVSGFLGPDPPRAVPSILNAESLGLDIWRE